MPTLPDTNYSAQNLRQLSTAARKVYLALKDRGVSAEQQALDATTLSLSLESAWGPVHDALEELCHHGFAAKIGRTPQRARYHLVEQPIPSSTAASQQPLALATTQPQMDV